MCVYAFACTHLQSLPQPAVRSPHHVRRLALRPSGSHAAALRRVALRLCCLCAALRPHVTRAPLRQRQSLATTSETLAAHVVAASAFTTCVHAKLPVSGASSERSLDGRARYTSPARLFDIRFELLKARLRTLTWPPSSAPYELGEATTWKLSVAYRLGVTKRAYGACSDSTWSIFRWFYQIVKLAAHAQKVQFGL